MSTRIELAGRTFGSWTVLEFSHTTKAGSVCWLCRCACGVEVAVRGSDLAKGRTTRCQSCFRQTNAAAYAIAPRRGLAAIPYGQVLSGVWHKMRSRCQDPRNKDWKHYGGRGIAVCERWLVFENFYEDVAPTYQPGLTLDRVNVNGPYSPDNFRWATQTQQHRNRTNNRLYTFRGRTATAAEWAELLGLQYGTIYARIERYGWAVERALTTGADRNALAVLYASDGRLAVQAVADVPASPFSTGDKVMWTCNGKVWAGQIEYVANTDDGPVARIATSPQPGGKYRTTEVVACRHLTLVPDGAR